MPVSRPKGRVLVSSLVVCCLLGLSLYGQSILTRIFTGTGFVVSSDGYILTNRHVVEGATKINVTVGSQEYQARIVEVLSDNDIALLKIDAQGLPTVMLGNSDEVQIGDTIYAIGCPLGICGTVTEGRVANIGISMQTKKGLTLHNLIMTDITITHGSSGGPLLNNRGEVIGITTGGIVAQRSETGFGYAIPINQAIPLLRKVPGFSMDQIGRATRVLSLKEIRQRVGPSTVFVKVQVQRPLNDLLPREVLGRPLTQAWPCIVHVLACDLESEGVDLNILPRYVATMNKIVQGTVPENVFFNSDGIGSSEEIIVAIFDCKTTQAAAHAINYLVNPTQWKLSTTCLSLEFLKDFCFSIWALLKDANTYLTKNQNIGPINLHTIVLYYLHPTPPYPGEHINLGKPLQPYAILWGISTFYLEDLAFLIMYTVHVRGPLCPGPRCPVWYTPNDFGLPTFTYTWEHVRETFVFSAEEQQVFSVDYGLFLENYQEILTAVLRVVLGQ